MLGIFSAASFGVIDSFFALWPAAKGIFKNRILVAKKIHVYYIGHGNYVDNKVFGANIDRIYGLNNVKWKNEWQGVKEGHLAI